MPDRHTEAAKLLRGLTQRVSELEQQTGSSWDLPNLIREVDETVDVDDSITVTETATTSTTWQQDDWGSRNWE